MSSSMSSTIAISSSTPRVVKKGISVKKSSIDVAAVLASLQFISQTTSEESVLMRVSSPASLHTSVLLLMNDRAAFFAWVESDDVKEIFSRVKQLLQDHFSPRLQHLIDETLTPSDGPPVDVLSFTDPAISQEKVIFIRVRNRLYEFHIALKSEAAISRLIAALSK